VLQEAVDDPSAVEPGRDREAPGDGGGSSPASAVPAVVSIALPRLLIVAGAVNEHQLRRRCAPEQQATSPACRSRPSHTDTGYYLVTTVLNAADEDARLARRQATATRGQASSPLSEDGGLAEREPCQVT
jgi:hypothetical protein